MLTQTGPCEFTDPTTGTTVNVVDRPVFHVEFRTPAGVRVLYGERASRAVDAIQLELVRQSLERRAQTTAPALWPWWSGEPIPFVLADEQPCCCSGTQELMNGEPVELDLRD